MSDVEMSRVSVQLPVETVDQLRSWASRAGLKPGQFYSVALVIGARVLARQVVPEQFLTPDVIKGIADGLGVGPAAVQEAIDTGSARLA